MPSAMAKPTTQTTKITKRKTYDQGGVEVFPPSQTTSPPEKETTSPPEKATRTPEIASAAPMAHSEMKRATKKRCLYWGVRPRPC